MNLFGQILWSLLLVAILCLLGYVLLDFRALWIRAILFGGVFIFCGYLFIGIWRDKKQPFTK